MNNTINWKEFWDKYNDWFEDLSGRPKCNTCGHIVRREPPWPDQQVKLEQLIDKQVREIVEKKIQE